MANRIIDKSLILQNMKDMAESLEFDSMRSTGKAKANAPALFYLYANIDRYTKELSTPNKTVRKEA